MGGNGKHRWKISFSSRTKPNQPQTPAPTPNPPKEFLCPITGSLMSDPVIVSSGQTFERVSVQVCLNLNFSPLLENNSTPDFSTIIPNLAFKKTILNWCDSSGADHPLSPEYSSVEKLVRDKMKNSRDSGLIRFSERELLKGVAENPPVLFSHANTELTHPVNHFCSTSSEESVIVNAASSSPLTPLPFATKPACYSSGSCSSENVMENPNLSDGGFNSPEEEEIVEKLKSSEVEEQEKGVVLLRTLSRAKEELRGSLCTVRVLNGLRPLIVSRYGVVQTNAIASLLNLSLEKSNKVKIVRLGFLPLLIDVLKGGSLEPQQHAAGTLFSLALEDENKMAIGVLGGLQPLMHALRSESEATRQDSALALYHLSLVQSNRVKLVKLGAVSTLLSMVKSGDSASRVLLILCNLAASNEGRSAMLDANAVGILVGMLREGGSWGDTEATRENCVAALYALSHGSLRFKGLAKEARAVEVLREIEENGSQRAREKAKKIMLMMRGREEEGEDVDWEAALMSDGVSRSRFRIGQNHHGPNSTNF